MSNAEFKQTTVSDPIFCKPIYLFLHVIYFWIIHIKTQNCFENLVLQLKLMKK